MADYLEVNRANWDDRAPLHAASPGYGVQHFVEDPGFLSGVVTFDLPRLGDIEGLRAVHLQCHIGTDTISLARLGARMTGLDFSSASLAEARTLAARVGAEIDFVQANVYDAADVLGQGSFDLVYTGVGALCWLPSISRWAQMVAALLRPGGRLFIREDHPILWAVDEERQDGLVIGYPYFEREEPMVWSEASSYVETQTVLTATETQQWNHGIGEIVTALLEAGMELTALVEHDSVPWNAIPGQLEQLESGEWRLIEGRSRMPLSYTLQAIKRG